MQTFELVMIALIGTISFVGLSAALYAALPPAVLRHASLHGRYVGLGTPERLDDSAKGNTPASTLAGLQGQSA